MTPRTTWLAAAATAAFLIAATAPAQAAIQITEAAPWASGNAPYAADWFELTNTGAVDVAITGWKIDDSSASFGSAAALTGVSTIKAGESVIFLETSSLATTRESFLQTWFGASRPAGLQVGGYTGSGLGLSTGGDGVNIFNDTGGLQASLGFGVADAVAPFQTFDNVTGSPVLSTVGVRGAFVAATDVNEIGSPGAIAAVPEPETYAMLLAGLGLIGTLVRRRARG